MDPKIPKRPFWKAYRRRLQESSTKSQTLEGKKLPNERETLRRIYLDDTSVGLASQTKIIVQRRPNASECAKRDVFSVCIPAAYEGFQDDLLHQQMPETSESVHELLVWYRSVLYRATRRRRNGETTTEYLRDLYLALTSAKEPPSNCVTLFQILDENRRQFRAINPNDLLKNGTLLKLNVSSEHVSPGHSQVQPSFESILRSTSLGSSAEINIEQCSAHPKRPTVLPIKDLPSVSAPLLPRRRNLCKLPSAALSDLSSASESPRETTPDMLPTQISVNSLLSGSNRQAATTTVRGPPPTLFPATLQIGPNGEKHLVVQYTDGQVFAAAFPQQGHLHFLPVSRAILPKTDGGCTNISATTSVLPADNSEDSGISTTLASGNQESPEQPSSQWPRQPQVAKAKLVCTCPPELHQVIRQSQLPDHPCELLHPKHTQRHSTPPSRDTATTEATLHSSHQTPNPVPNSFPDAASRTNAGRWSSDNFQESDSTDTTSGSGQVVYPIIRGGIPPDVLLAPGTTDKFRLTAKPPQTLEEAQTRIAFMEDQMAFLTSWVQAVQEQQGGQLKRSSEPADNPNNRTSFLTRSSGEHACSQRDLCLPSNSTPESAHSPKSAHGWDSCCRNVDVAKPSLLHSPKTSSWISQSDQTGFQTHSQMGNLQVSPGMQWRLDNLKRTQLLQVSQRLLEVKNELGNLRKTQESDIGSLRKISADILREIHRLLEKPSLRKLSPLRTTRLDLDSQISTYLAECNDVEDWLRDLEACIEELRIDALQRRCRVSVSDVETYALHLSRLSGRLVAFKEEIPELKRATTTALLAEKNAAHLQEQFLDEEPKRLDAALSTCKQLTCTLFTLKRLGSVQEHGLTMNIPPLRTIRDPQPEDKNLYLQQIKNIIPDHEARILGLACHKTARLRRKRMLSLRDSLKFEQSVGESRRNLDSILTRLGHILLHQQTLIPSSSSHPLAGYRTEEREQDKEVSPHRRLRSVAAQTFGEQLLREESAEGQSHTQQDETSQSSADLWRCEQAPDPACCDYCDSPRGSEAGVHRSLAQQTPRSNREVKRRGGSEEPQADYSQSRQNTLFSAQESFSPKGKSNAVTGGDVCAGGTRRPRVVFSRTVLVGDGRETTRLNCASDLDEDDHTETSELEEQSGHHPWRKEQLHRGNKVVDIHPGLPRNQYINCGGLCGIQGGCTQTCCPARPRQSASVLKSSLASSSSVEKSAPPAPPPRMSSSSSSAIEKQRDLLFCVSGSDAHHDHILPAETDIRGPITEEDSDAILSAEGSGHHQYCRLSSSDQIQRKG